MAVDPEVGARVARITGADPSVASTAAEREALTAKAFAAVGMDSTAVMGAPVAIYAFDMAGRIAFWNRAAEELFGWTAEEIIGQRVPFIADDEHAKTMRDAGRLLEGEILEDVEFSPRHKDGRRLHVVTSATSLRDEHDQPTAIVAFTSDYTAERQAVRDLEGAQRKWQQLLTNISDTVTILDIEGRVKEATGEFTDVLGYDRAEWEAGRGFGFIHLDDRVRAVQIWQDLVTVPESEQLEVFRTRHADGHYELIEYRGVNLLHDPIINGIVMTTRNVTQERAAEALVADEARVLELIARDAPLNETLAAITDLVESHSGGATAILLVTDEARRLDIGAAGSVPSEVLEMARRTPMTPHPHAPTFDLRRRTVVRDYATDPRTQPVAARARQLGIQAAWAAPIIENRTEELLGVISTYYDEVREPTEHESEVAGVASHLAAIAIERNRWHQALAHQAQHHQLTGLPNRSLILEQLEAAIARAVEQQSTLAVMFIDLDRFKVVNDSLGHAAGDKLLVRFGGRLRNLVRPGDFVGHFGADEFVVILERITETDDLRFVANRLDLALGEPFALDEGEIFLSASIGVAVSRGGAETAELLLQHADAAMFRAKDLGRDRMEIFDQEMRVHAMEQLRIDRDLRLGMDRDELDVYYQPEVNLQTGRIVGVEALLRWHHPEAGLVLPEDFIGVAEETGIIVRIGRWMLERSMQQARSWMDSMPGIEPFALSVNLSGRQLTTPGFAEQVSRMLERTGWPPDKLVLELTESILMDDREATLEVLIDLKDVGVMLAIDDFGTGFSSLNYLHRFPVDIVKIDGSFVVNLQATGQGSPVATAIMHMAHALGLTVTAEGIEEPQQLAGLRVLGCDVGQGFLFAAPCDGDEIASLIRANRIW